jgi:ABC-type transport system involved in cytochrome c biogenesis permease subunit
MSAITTPPSSGPACEERMTRRGASPLKKVLLPLASLRLTVVLFVLSLILVWCGTLAQRDAGIHVVVNHYFRGDWKTAGFIWVPLKHLVFFAVPGGFPFPGGFLLGGALLVNLLAAHAVRFRLSWQRSGILVLHSGLILLLVGEFITRQYAVEGNMTIPENGSSDYLEHRTATELAVVSSADARTDDVVVIPEALLRRGGVLRDDHLPFDVEVVRYMVNSAIQDKVPPGTANPATAGEGRHLLAVEQPPVSGTNSKEMDLASAYVTLRARDSGESLGTYLTSIWLTDAAMNFPPAQAVRVGGKDYDVSLRFKRTYKPYAIHLLQFKRETYEGTDKDMSYASLVRLVDPARGEKRETLISMNNPLRYEGETFYQSGFLPGDTGTILQVVHNPAAQLPYWACALVAAGMLIHFGLTLVRFLNKQSAGPVGVPVLTPTEDGPPAAKEAPVLAAPPVPRGGGQITVRAAARATSPAGRIAAAKHRKPAAAVASAGAPPAAEGTTFDRVFPWVVLGLGVLWVAVAMAQPTDPAGQMHLQEFAALPVSEGGRIKPVDSIARNNLMVVSNRQTYYDADGHSYPAVKWLLDTMTFVYFENREAEKVPLVRIENDQVLGFLGLKARPGFRYSIAEVWPKWAAIKDKALGAEKRKEEERDLFDVKIIELARRMQAVVRLAMLEDPRTLLLPSDNREWQTLQAVLAEGERDRDLAQRLRALGRMSKMLDEMDAPFRLQPPANSQWRTCPEALEEARHKGAVDPALLAYTGILEAYARKDTEAFNKAVAEYRSEIETRAAQGASLAGFERFFNNFEPFYHCSLLYVAVFLLGCLSWLGWSRPLGRAAYALALLTLVVHTFALVSRMVIMHKPPVTNLYSTAIFIGWVGVLLCLAVEPFFRLRIGTVVAGFGGAVTMLLAHLLASGDTMEVLEPVLNTPFWLATHVVCVNIGYATTYVAGLFGMGYLLYGALRLRNPELDRGVFKTLAQMTYGAICFATFFSFVGTVLGGIWADQSWGRFWGWDPKENGALLIVIWNALILHARWAGLARERGVALLAVFGNIITSWSYFGTNLLGIGLHNYGFTHGAFWGLLGAETFFLLWLGGGLLLPRRAWR